jgi:predicted DNA binding CopG/RHH family protein
MTQNSEFPFAEFPFDGLRPTVGHRAHRVTPAEHQHFKTLLAQQLGTQSVANTVITPEEPYQAVSLQLHPKILNWAKAEAQKRGIEYQTVINEVLRRQVS